MTLAFILWEWRYEPSYSSIHPRYCLQGKKLRQTSWSNFFTTLFFISATKHHWPVPSMPLSEALTLAERHKVRKKNPVGFVFLYTFLTDQNEIWCGVEAVQMDTIVPLCKSISWSVGSNYMCTNCTNNFTVDLRSDVCEPMPFTLDMIAVTTTLSISVQVWMALTIIQGRRGARKRTNSSSNIMIFFCQFFLLLVVCLTELIHILSCYIPSQRR